MNPRIKRIFSIVAHSLDCVELRAGTWEASSHVLQDDSRSGTLLNIIKSLNGNASIQDIAAQYQIPVADVEGVLEQLKRLDAIEFGESTAFDYYINHFDATLKKYTPENTFRFPVMFVNDDDISREIARILHNETLPEKLQIKFFNDNFTTLCHDFDPKIMHEGLAFEKLVEKFESWRGHFIVFTQPFIHPIACHYVNRICYALEIPWMHVAVDGPSLFVGPIFTGKVGPCYDCFETRILMNIKQQESYLHYKEALARGAVVSPGAPMHQIIASLLASHAAIEILNYCLTEFSFAVRKVLSIYLCTMEMSYNEVLALSGCECCGSLARRDDQQLYFDVQSLIA
jgi:bacteriocin biosynthesis cyclodehydratase domain-containing protein